MKIFKYLSLAAIAVLLLAPATAIAKTHFSVSLNLFQQVAPMFAPRALIVPPPHLAYFVPAPVYRERTIVREYYYPQQVVIHDISPMHYPPRPHPRLY